VNKEINEETARLSKFLDSFKASMPLEILKAFDK